MAYKIKTSFKNQDEIYEALQDPRFDALSPENKDKVYDAARQYFVNFYKGKAEDSLPNKSITGTSAKATGRVRAKAIADVLELRKFKGDVTEDESGNVRPKSQDKATLGGTGKVIGEKLLKGAIAFPELAANVVGGVPIDIYREAKSLVQKKKLLTPQERKKSFSNIAEGRGLPEISSLIGEAAATIGSKVGLAKEAPGEDSEYVQRKAREMSEESLERKLTPEEVDAYFPKAKNIGDIASEEEETIVHERSPKAPLPFGIDDILSADIIPEIVSGGASLALGGAGKVAPKIAERVAASPVGSRASQILQKGRESIINPLKPPAKPTLGANIKTGAVVGSEFGAESALKERGDIPTAQDIAQGAASGVVIVPAVHGTTKLIDRAVPGYKERANARKIFSEKPKEQAEVLSEFDRLGEKAKTRGLKTEVPTVETRGRIVSDPQEAAQQYLKGGVKEDVILDELYPPTPQGKPSVDTYGRPIEPIGRSQPTTEIVTKPGPADYIEQGRAFELTQKPITEQAKQESEFVTKEEANKRFARQGGEIAAKLDEAAQKGKLLEPSTKPLPRRVGINEGEESIPSVITSTGETAGLLPGKTQGKPGQPGFQDITGINRATTPSLEGKQSPLYQPNKAVIPQPGPPEGVSRMNLQAEQPPKNAFEYSNRIAEENENPMRPYQQEVVEKGGAGNIPAFTEATQKTTYEPSQSLVEQNIHTESSVEEIKAVDLDVYEATGNNPGGVQPKTQVKGGAKKVAKKIKAGKGKASNVFKQDKADAELISMTENINKPSTPVADEIIANENVKGETKKSAAEFLKQKTVEFLKSEEGSLTLPDSLVRMSDDLGENIRSFGKAAKGIYIGRTQDPVETIRKTDTDLARDIDIDGVKLQLFHTQIEAPVWKFLQKNGGVNSTEAKNIATALRSVHRKYILQQINTPETITRRGAQGPELLTPTDQLMIWDALTPAEKAKATVLAKVYNDSAKVAGFPEEHLISAYFPKLRDIDAAEADALGMPLQRDDGDPFYFHKRTNDELTGSDVIEFTRRYLNATRSRLIIGRKEIIQNKIIEAIKEGNFEREHALKQLRDNIVKIQNPNIFTWIHKNIAENVLRFNFTSSFSNSTQPIQLLWEELIGRHGMKDGSKVFSSAYGLLIHPDPQVRAAVQGLLTKMGLHRQSLAKFDLASEGSTDVRLKQVLGIREKGPREIKDFIEDERVIDLFGNIETELNQPVAIVSAWLSMFGGDSTKLINILKSKSLLDSPAKGGSGENLGYSMEMELLRQGNLLNKKVNFARNIFNRNYFENQETSRLALLFIGYPLREVGLLSHWVTNRNIPTSRKVQLLTTYMTVKIGLVGSDAVNIVALPIVGEFLEQHAPDFWAQFQDKIQILDEASPMKQSGINMNLNLFPTGVPYLQALMKAGKGLTQTAEEQLEPTYGKAVKFTAEEREELPDEERYKIQKQSDEFKTARNISNIFSVLPNVTKFPIGKTKEGASRILQVGTKEIEKVYEAIRNTKSGTEVSFGKHFGTSGKEQFQGLLGETTKRRALREADKTTARLQTYWMLGKKPPERYLKTKMTAENLEDVDELKVKQAKSLKEKMRVWIKNYPPNDFRHKTAINTLDKYGFDEDALFSGDITDQDFAEALP